MVFTEVKNKSGRKYYYRTVSKRKNGKVSKKRIYLGTDLDKTKLAEAESEADMELGILDSLLDPRELEFLEAIKKEHARRPDIILVNIYEVFTTQFTHDSTAIEGNTLTIQETGSLLFENISPSGKSMRDINEVLGHKNAFDFMLQNQGKITKKFICKLHAILMKDTSDARYNDMIGSYRTVPVYIRGVEWTPPAPEDVGGEMQALLSWHTRNSKKTHPVIAAIYFHVGFEIVHPFFDGNGRVGRLLFNYILHRSGYPMVSMPNAQKNRYYHVLGKAQVDGDLRPFIDFILELYRDDMIKF
jgi:Fic family protein